MSSAINNFLKNHNKKAIYILGGLLVILILVWIAVFVQSADSELTVDFLDVGQGDAIFITSPEGHQVLIDGGPDSKILEELNKVMPFYDRYIDIVLLTHPDLDHLGGLMEVLKHYQVGKVIDNNIVCNTNYCQEWDRLIDEKNISRLSVQLGDRIKLGRVARIMILYPFDNIRGEIFKNSNQASIVSKLIYGQNTFLFTSDADRFVEDKMIARGIDLGADVLKVGHHGSKSSTGEFFVNKVSPTAAVIQVGENSYGHPHQLVLKALEGIKVFRNDLDGRIRIKSDGYNIRAKME